MKHWSGAYPRAPDPCWVWGAGADVGSALFLPGAGASIFTCSMLGASWQRAAWWRKDNQHVAPGSEPQQGRTQKSPRGWETCLQPSGALWIWVVFPQQQQQQQKNQIKSFFISWAQPEDKCAVFVSLPEEHLRLSISMCHFWKQPITGVSYPNKPSWLLSVSQCISPSPQLLPRLLALAAGCWLQVLGPPQQWQSYGCC